MVIHAPKPRPVASGFWTFCDQTGDLRHVDAHADSTVCTRWPLLDRWHRNLIERGVDWLLNAAGAGRERLDAALRVPYPGSRIDRLPPIQSAFWHRLLHGLSGGAQAQLFLGDGVANSFTGLALDDSFNGRTVAGWSGGGSGSGNYDLGLRGGGLGGGNGGAVGRSGGGGGGYGTVGSSASNYRSGSHGGGRYPTPGGPAVPAIISIDALRQNSFTSTTLGLGGGGGGGWDGGGGSGGNGGSCHLQISTQSLLVTASLALSGGSGRSHGGGGSKAGGGGGSGGLHFLVARGSVTLDSEVVLSAPGGARGHGQQPGSPGQGGASGGNGGNGRVIICYGDSVDTSAGRINNAVLTAYQLLPSLPLGQVRVS
ncbi:MAG: hypothetical protein OXO54_11810 [Chloroflexota bacterium]|nr:hypothetical protein [Chloroflexota bacterium]